MYIKDRREGEERKISGRERERGKRERGQKGEREGKREREKRKVVRFNSEETLAFP